MNEFSNIKQFSRDIYLNFQQYYNIPLPLVELESLKPPKFILEATKTLDEFSDAFCSEFHDTFEKHVSEIRDTDEQFMIYLIPRCLKLCEDETYFTFMLVAAFIGELVTYLIDERKCYRFAGTAYKCLVAIFKRRFEATFEDNGGWLGLELFCRKINSAIREEGAKSEEERQDKAYVLTAGDKTLENHLFDLIKECDNLEDECFALSAYELALLAEDNTSFIETELIGRDLVIEPFQFDWSMVIGSSKLNIVSNMDLETGLSSRITSDIIEYGSDSEAGMPECEPSVSLEEIAQSVETNLVPEAVAEHYSDYDNEENNSSSSLLNFSSDYDGAQNILKSMASSMARQLEPVKYDQMLSAFVCEVCGKKCFQYAKYYFRKHSNASEKQK